MRPRCPLPMGAIRSMTRAAISWGSVSSRSRSVGNSGVSLSKCGRFRASYGSSPLTASIFSRALYFSLSLGSRTWPVTSSPRLSPKRRICDSET